MHTILPSHQKPSTALDFREIELLQNLEEGTHTWKIIIQDRYTSF